MNIEITNYQRRIIIKAIENIKTLYDFENTTDKEFKESYDISKRDLREECKDLLYEVFK